jgi:TonB family protein
VCHCMAVLGMLVLVTSASPQVRRATTPLISPLALQGGEVVLEVGIDENGVVSGVQTLDSAPPYDEPLAAAVRDWTFEPTGAPSRVLVAAVFRAAALFENPLSRPVHDTAAAEVPFPVERRWPLYPPLARGDWTVILEATVSSTGAVESLRTLVSAPSFDEAAWDAAYAWRFRPARRAGRAVASTAILVFGFRAPVAFPLPPH